MYKYRIVREKAYHPDIGAYHTYGIAVRENGTILQTQHDVSVERAVAKSIAVVCAEEQVEPVHMEDVIADLLP